MQWIVNHLHAFLHYKHQCAIQLSWINRSKHICTILTIISTTLDFSLVFMQSVVYSWVFRQLKICCASIKYCWSRDCFCYETNKTVKFTLISTTTNQTHWSMAYHKITFQNSDMTFLRQCYNIFTCWITTKMRRICEDITTILRLPYNVL